MTKGVARETGVWHGLFPRPIRSMVDNAAPGT